MGLNLEPVKVSIEIETTSLARDAFYNICFITDNEKAPRTLKVERLKDLLDNGYDRSSLAYNFCVGVFAQQGIPFVYVRAKRYGETYESAYKSDNNSDYYFVVIESKNVSEINNFNDFLISNGEVKLHYYSHYEYLTNISKAVGYFQESEYLDEDSDEDFYLRKAYLEQVSTDKLESQRYPLSPVFPTSQYQTGKFSVENIKMPRLVLETSGVGEYSTGFSLDIIEMNTVLVKESMGLEYQTDFNLTDISMPNVLVEASDKIAYNSKFGIGSTDGSGVSEISLPFVVVEYDRQDRPVKYRSDFAVDDIKMTIQEDV